MDAVLGIDIAKAKFQVALLVDDKIRHKTFVNAPAGFQQLAEWLHRHAVTAVHACLEATGAYGDALAAWLHDAGHDVSVVNPAIIHAYARTRLARSKTDRLDAELIARFTATQHPARWTPPAREIRERVTERFDVDDQSCERDVDAFLRDLLREGLAESIEK